MLGKRRRMLLIAAVALTGLLPPAAFLVISYFQTMHQADQRLQRYAALSVDRADEIFGRAETTLAAMAQQLERRCTRNTYEALRRAVYESLYFREAGLIADGAVQCTSMRVFKPPVPIKDPDHRVLPDHAIHISAPAQTLEGPVAIIIGYGTGDNGGFDLLLNPQVLGEPLQRLFADDQIGVVLERSDGADLAQAGIGSAQSLERAGVVKVQLNSSRYPVRAVAFASSAWLRHNWVQNAYLFGSLGLLTSALLFLALLYLIKAQNSSAAGLRDALADGQFQVFYQPVLEAASGRCIGAEALLRWQHPQLGLVLPGLFIPAAEETGFIVPLTNWVMQRVVADMAEVAGANPDFHISLNLSPAHFLHPKLIDSIKEAFDERMPPHRIIFEITEHQLIAGHDGPALEILQNIRATGARVALDDFGTGYSSLKYLSRFPFDYLKIDKAFVDAIGTESVTAGLTDTIVAMANQLKLRTVAEGVENAVQLEHLQRLKVDFLQGWLFSKALPADQFIAFLRNHEPFRPSRATPLRRTGA